ncbi:MAG TPA: alternative ribosome rescue aminoacyl-tRNA hydrolase ArfB [Deltaproteobacteria bacterium]|nr:alternative ribosome rescue aminoacyl-tRNA hydrolase ArfB [Deltaproteobacteria bacterium]HOM28235.1 alternative ribosome rescue aminoacyl-tRNA hydrolase ArfB [Deltaproteobacteria bacterium]HPP79617.1 alternative ribosome rescue aminoacyl-tRNA hydrolase ArfB [Deltaproteobacteria bacterium]
MEGTRGDVTIDASELRWEFCRAGGPGGQNVNKVSSAVVLRFDVAGSPSLAPGVKERLARLAGRRMTADGVLVIRAQRFRSQEKNREDALARLKDLILEAERVPRRRVRTGPPASSRMARLEEKRSRARKKRMRAAARDHDPGGA